MNARHLVVLRGRLWVSSGGDVHDLQCVARTKKGRRCQNPIEYGQILGWHEFSLGTAGYVMAYGGYGGDSVSVDRWLAQHCTLHDSPDVVDYDTPELRRFDIATDADHIRPHRVDVLHTAVV